MDVSSVSSPFLTAMNGLFVVYFADFETSIEKSVD